MAETYAECQLCIKDRVQAGEKPLMLITLERAKKQDGMGRVCPDCDLGVVKLVERSHNE